MYTLLYITELFSYQWVISGASSIRRNNEKGRKLFQVSIMRWSYRIRGRVARTAMNSVAKEKLVMISVSWPHGVFNRAEVKSAAEKALITMMFIYSAMKMKAKLPPPYSTLNPDTSSDSPSAKSNGVRFVSARIETNQQANKGGASSRDHAMRSKSGVAKL